MTMVEDKRGKKVAFVANCILNQNAKVNGFAFFPDLIFEMIEILHKHNFGLVQFPCPETSYAGMRRWWYVREQYDTPVSEDTASGFWNLFWTNWKPTTRRTTKS